MTKYHADIYMPQPLRNMGQVTCNIGQISYHAKKAAKSDRYGRIFIPNTIIFSGENIIEAEICKDNRGEKSLKLVVRIPSGDPDFDLCIVILFVDNFPIVKTVWLNSKYDQHDTLDESQYYDPFRL